MMTVCMLPRTVVTTAEGVGVHDGCEACSGGDEVVGGGVDDSGGAGDEMEGGEDD